MVKSSRALAPDSVWYYNLDFLNGNIRVPGNWIPNFFKGIVLFPGSPGIGSPSIPFSSPISWSFDFSIYFCVAFIYLGLFVIWCQIEWCFVT